MKRFFALLPLMLSTAACGGEFEPLSNYDPYSSYIWHKTKATNASMREDHETACSELRKAHFILVSERGLIRAIERNRDWWLVEKETESAIAWCTSKGL